MLMELTRAFYTSKKDYEMVHKFNHQPAQFDFDALLKKLGSPGASGGSSSDPPAPTSHPPEGP